jgi:thiosulfate/3-mercaptopyruvate sulfurtransferase
MAAAAAAAASLRNVVSCEWLAAAVRAAQPAVQVIDCSWHMPAAARDARKEFLAQRVPGSVFFDLDQCVPPKSETELPHMMPSAATLATYLGALGLEPHKPTVVYDASAFGLFSSPRLWWMLKTAGMPKVAVLDGGLRRWKQLALPLDSGAPAAAKPKPFPAPRYSAGFVAAPEVLEGVRRALAREQLVVDARSQGRFVGSEPEPRPGLRRGHIPGSLNVPFTAVLDPAAGTLLPKPAALEVFKKAGLDPDRPLPSKLVFSCGSGVTACVPLLALVEHWRVPLDRVAVYDGAFAEWGKEADAARFPIALGPK